VEILVRQDFTPAEVKQARLAASEYRKKQATSGAENVLNLTDLKKSVVLCDSHARKLHKKHGYRLHPEIPRVLGRCDVCQAYGPGRFFVDEATWLESRKSMEKYRRALEYGRIVSG